MKINLGGRNSKINLGMRRKIIKLLTIQSGGGGGVAPITDTNQVNGNWYLINGASYTISSFPTDTVDSFNELGQLLYMYNNLK